MSGPNAANGVTVTGLDEFTAMLDRIGAGAKDAAPVLVGAVNELVSEYFVMQFTTEGLFGLSGTWAALTPMTLKLRERPGHGRGGIGDDVGTMMDSLTHHDAPESVMRVESNTLTRGTEVPWAQYFDQGSVQSTMFGRPRKATVTIPARQLTPDVLPDAWVEQVRGAVDAYFATLGG